jgi:acyl-coenzyme A thioesterase PaaI-like protein
VVEGRPDFCQLFFMASTKYVAFAAVTAAAASVLLITRRRTKQATAAAAAAAAEDDDDGDADDEAALRALSGWLLPLWDDPAYESVAPRYPEWGPDAASYRRANGWLGHDLVHSARASGPRIVGYWVERATRTLVGIVRFGPGCESHRGLCHGGAMCSVLDDVLGHTAFISDGAAKGPWSGATVQVNCKLKKACRVGAVMKVWGRVRERKGRRAFIDGGLEAEDGTVHAVLDGVTVECTREQLLG